MEATITFSPDLYGVSGSVFLDQLPLDSLSFDPLSLNLDPFLLVLLDLKKKDPKAMLNRGSRSSHWILQQTGKKNSLGHSMAATDVTE